MTASPTTLLALATDVEAATGPDRELDARVWVATHPDDWLVLFGTAGAQDYVINSIEGGSLALQPLTASVDAALGLMREVLQEFQAREIQIKDLDRGLIDFPAIIGGREVFLCWEQDEDAIEYWHDLDTGFAGREKL